jgi:hypothetical protein
MQDRVAAPITSRDNDCGHARCRLQSEGPAQSILGRSFHVDASPHWAHALMFAMRAASSTQRTPPSPSMLNSYPLSSVCATMPATSIADNGAFRPIRPRRDSVPDGFAPLFVKQRFASLACTCAPAAHLPVWTCTNKSAPRAGALFARGASSFGCEPSPEAADVAPSRLSASALLASPEA